MTKNQVIYPADKYAQYRPTYPQALFDYIYQYVSTFNTAWDCGCGNGQAANKLAEKFTHVIATDSATNQIECSIRKSNITYKIAAAEQAPITDHSIDLITVAQAMHWFDHDAFALEVTRVLKPKGVLAAWGYAPPRVNQAVDAIIDYCAFDLLTNYWAAGRQYLDNHYKNIPFPFEKIEHHDFYCEKQCSLEGLIGYLESWSPRLNYMQQHHRDPLDLIKADLTTAWGNPRSLSDLTC